MLSSFIAKNKNQLASRIPGAQLLGLAAKTTVLEKLELSYKDPKGEDVSFLFQYNPTSLKINKKANWNNVDGNQKDVQAKQFEKGEARTLSISGLLFDTTAIGNMSVYTNYIEALETMLLVQDFGKKGQALKRPPYVTLSWGKSSYFFESVLKDLDYEFTMFSKAGIPVRAKVDLTFEEIITDGKKAEAGKVQKKGKVHTAKAGETLQKIAQDEYKDPNKWKIIATANGIEDPMYISAGTKLTLPALAEE